MTRPRLDHRDFRVALAVLLVAGVGLCVWIYSLNQKVTELTRALRAAEAERRGFEARVEAERHRAESDRESLDNRIDESRRRQEQIQKRLAEVADGRETRALTDELGRVRSRLSSLERERTAGEQVIRRYGSGVCLIQASYAFYDGDGRPLRYRVDGAGEKLREADGSASVDVAGKGEVHSVDAIGTGFLADRRGYVVTNRHVVEPWWRNETADALAQDGYQPRLVVLRAFFPRIKEALELSLHQVSTSVDLAVLRVDLAGRRIPALPLDASGRGAVPGQPVVVLGYPTGLEAIMAKAEGGVVQEILTAQGTSSGRVAEALSRRGLIRPSTTQGHIGDVTSSDIVFDAATSQGGSGGPVFNKHGRVIAVEYAMLPQFAGNSYGLPVRYALELIGRPRS
jgi:S1-C subfamily serine protease